MRLSDEAIDWLVRLSSGRATPRDRLAFLAWRARSPEHELAAHDAEALLRDVGDTRAADLLRRHPEMVAQAAGPAHRWRIGRRALFGGTAAAAAVAAAAGVGMFGPMAALYADYATSIGERRQVALPDGSIAFLNTATALSVDYSDAYRRLVLHGGEAQFEVAKDAARPFIVTARNAETRAVGTIFTVCCREAETDVTVSEGTVEVQVGTREAVRLDAGQRLSYTAAGARAPEAIDADAATAWRRGKLIFNRRPLQEVVTELERYRSGRIVILGERLKTLRVTGVFDLDEPDTLLHTIEATTMARLVHLPLLTLIR
jgi:transmembrane sensor